MTLNTIPTRLIKEICSFYGDDYVVISKLAGVNKNLSAIAKSALSDPSFIESQIKKHNIKIIDPSDKPGEVLRFFQFSLKFSDPKWCQNMFERLQKFLPRSHMRAVDARNECNKKDHYIFKRILMLKSEGWVKMFALLINELPNLIRRDFFIDMIIDDYSDELDDDEEIREKAMPDIEALDLLLYLRMPFEWDHLSKNVKNEQVFDRLIDQGLFTKRDEKEPNWRKLHYEKKKEKLHVKKGTKLKDFSSEEKSEILEDVLKAQPSLKSVEKLMRALNLALDPEKDKATIERLLKTYGKESDALKALLTGSAKKESDKKAGDSSDLG